MPSNHLILCHPLLLLPSIFPSLRVFSNESALHIRWPKYWSFSFNISPSSEHPGLISSRMDWLDLLAVQGTLKSLLQHHSSKASILRCSAFFIVQLSHPYMTTGKTIALNRRTSVGKVISLLLNMLSPTATAAKSLQLCLTLCDPIDGSPPGSPRPWDSPGKNTGVGCHFLFQCMKVKSEREVAQSCLTLSDTMGYSLPGSSIHGIFQARVLEWGAIAFFDMLSRLVIIFLPRSKRLLISWLQSPSAVIFEPQKIKSGTVSPSISHEVMGSDAMIFIF